MYKLSYLAEKNVRLFLVRVLPYSENRVKFFSHLQMTIYTPIDSPCRVKSKYVVFKFF